MDENQLGSASYDFGSLSASDSTEWGKMQAYTAAPQGTEQVPWWANLVSYGVTKAVDNTFPTQYTGIQGNTAPGSFAGQNGRTYSQVGGLNAAPTLSGLAQGIGRMSPVTLALIAGAAYFLLKK